MSDESKVEVKETPKTDNALAAKVRVTEKKVDSIIKFIEKMFGIDINQDGKVGYIHVGWLLAIAAIMTFAVVYKLHAAPFAQASTSIWNLASPTNPALDVAKIDSDGNLRVAGTITSGGAVNGLTAHTTTVVTYTGQYANLIYLTDTNGTKATNQVCTNMQPVTNTVISYY